MILALLNGIWFATTAQQYRRNAAAWFLTGLLVPLVFDIVVLLLLVAVIHPGADDWLIVYLLLEASSLVVMFVIGSELVPIIRSGQDVSYNRLKHLWAHVPLVGLSIIFIIPFAWLLTTSFKERELIFVDPPVWIFEPTLTHYIDAFTSAQFPYVTFLANSLFICELVVLGTVLSSAFVAYGLSRIEWRGRDTLFFCLLATMMLPGQVTMIPVFLIFLKLGWVNTFLPLVVPAFLGNAFFIFLLRQFFLSVPKDLQDAAKIDGCNELAIWWQIIMPLSKPALATVGLFSFLGSWNDFMGPLIYLFDESKYTMSLGLAMFQGQYGTQFGQLMAVSTVLTIPIVILFFFTQRTFIQGIKLTGTTG